MYVMQGNERVYALNALHFAATKGYLKICNALIKALREKKDKRDYLEETSVRSFSENYEFKIY